MTAAEIGQEDHQHRQCNRGKPSEEDNPTHQVAIPIPLLLTKDAMAYLLAFGFEGWKPLGNLF